MTIPQVNALATDRNRKQTRRICELKGWTVNPDRTALSPRPYAFMMQDGNQLSPPEEVEIPNGSFTLCQVVGMLEAEHVEYCGDSYAYTAYVSTQPDNRMNDPYVLRYADPHDLTAAMDALIKVLETKGEKT